MEPRSRSADRYRRIRELGEGGAGRVWLVEDRLRPGSRVALKELAVTTRQQMAALRREFVTLAALRHPNLVEVHDFDVDPQSGLPRFSLEYIDGEDFVTAARAEGPETLLELTAEALRALSFLHDFRLIHRDLKPANLIVRRVARQGVRLVVLDFGLALRGGVEVPRTRLAGTLPYIAPELLDGDAASWRSDLYSLGVILFEAIFGRLPIRFESRDSAAFIQEAKRGLDAVPQLPGGFPSGLGRWLEQLLAADPARRPAAASEALASLNLECDLHHPLDIPVTRAARLASGPPPGREPELERIWSALSREDEPQIVWLSGGPGTGKTRLLAWVASEAVRRGWNVVGQPFGPSDPAGSGKDAVVHAMDDLRARAAKERQLVVLDELETAEPRLLNLVERIATTRGIGALHVIAGVREAEARDPVLARLLQNTQLMPNLQRVVVGNFDHTSIQRVVERVAGDVAVSNKRAEWLLAASEGIPVVVESLLVEGVWEKRGSIKAHRGLEEAVAGVVRTLSDRSCAWLNALGVIGGSVPGSIIARLAGLTEKEARQAAEGATDAGLAVQKNAGWTLTSRAVTSHIMRRMTSGVRQRQARRAAELIEGSSAAGASPQRLARLWRDAGEAERSVGFALAAASNSERDGDTLDAAQWVRFALLQIERKDPRRKAWRFQQAELLVRADLYQAAARAFATAVRLTPEPAEKARLLARQSTALSKARRLELALALARRAHGLAERHGDSTDVGITLTALGLSLSLAARYDEAVETLDRAIATLDTTSQAATRAEALHYSAVCESNRRNLKAARGRFQQALEGARASGDVGLEAFVLIGLGLTATRDWKLSEAERWYLEALRLAEEHDLKRQHSIGLVNLALVFQGEGRFDRVISLMREAELQSLRMGDREGFFWAKIGLADALVPAGRPTEAVSELSGLLEGPLTGAEPRTIACVRGTLVEALLETPYPPEATIKDILEKLFAADDTPNWLALVLRVVDLERRVRSQCDEPFQSAWEQFEAAVDQSGQTLEAPMRVRAEIARARDLEANGDLSGALGVAESVARLAEQNRMLEFAAVSYDLMANAQATLGRLADSKKSYERGRKLLDEAAQQIKDADVRRDFLDRPVFRNLREASPGDAAGESRLMAIYRMIHALNSETDADQLLESMLDMALQVVGAERGLILLRDEPDKEFTVRLARNLEQETIADAEKFSRSVVLQAGSGRAVLSVDTGHDERLRDFKSVSMFGIRSILAVPLRSRGKIIGAVYLDNRKQGALFADDELKFLEAFADHAALALENAQIRGRLQKENQRLLVAAEERVQLGEMIGRSPGMQRVFDLVSRVADTHLPVLIQGESGTGKELVARAIHHLGPRKRKSFLSENCAALTESLLESELFGHVKGAFTGADKERHGLFEQADGGTLLLDEVGDMSPAMQARLLRVLQEGEVRRVGGDRPIHVDVRVLAATHRDLQDEVAAGRFREDLLYRLQVLLIVLPPLRERPGDVPLLVEHFLPKIGKARNRPAPRIRAAVMDLFERYHWPGNVRQLESTLQRLVLLAGERPITVEIVESDRGLRQVLIGSRPSQEPVYSLERNEKQQIQAALQAADGNRARAAKLLGISRATIFRKIKEYGLN